MGTTSLGIPYPENTDLVKDGAADMQALAEAANDLYGLVHINTTTIPSGSPVSSQSLNNIFSSGYENYKVVFNLASNQSDTNLTMRLRASGTDNSTASSYVLQSSNFNDTSISGARVTSNLWTIMSISNTQTWSVMYIDIYKPFIATKTLLSGLNTSSYLSSYTRVVGGTHNQATSYDGFTVAALAGNVYGEIRTYAYKD